MIRFASPKPPPPTQRLCRTCGYNLRGLAAPRCPECGTTFDPADPRTFITDPAEPAAWSAVAECLPWMFVEQLIALLLAAMILDMGGFSFAVLVVSAAFWLGVLIVCAVSLGWPTRGQVLYLKFGLPLLLVVGVPLILMLID